MNVSSVAVEAIAASPSNQPPRLEPRQSVARQVNESTAPPEVKSSAGESRGVKVDIEV